MSPSAFGVPEVASPCLFSCLLFPEMCRLLTGNNINSDASLVVHLQIHWKLRWKAMAVTTAVKVNILHWVSSSRRPELNVPMVNGPDHSAMWEHSDGCMAHRAEMSLLDLLIAPDKPFFCFHYQFICNFRCIHMFLLDWYFSPKPLTGHCK